MSHDIYAAAYSLALQQVAAAHQAAHDGLESRFPQATFDERYRATQRAFSLVDSASSLAEKVWLKAISHENAEAALLSQFPEFPESTVRSALSAALVAAR